MKLLVKVLTSLMLPKMNVPSIQQGLINDC